MKKVLLVGSIVSVFALSIQAGILEKGASKATQIAYAKKISKSMGISPKYALAILEGGGYKARETHPAVGLSCGGVMSVCIWNTADKWAEQGHPKDRKFWDKNGAFTGQFYAYKKSIKTGVKILTYCKEVANDPHPEAGFEQTIGQCYSFESGITDKQQASLDKINKGK